jgi:hypothetical protein
LQIQVQYIIKSDQACEEAKQNEQNTLETTGNKVIRLKLKMTIFNHYGKQYGGSSKKLKNTL